MAAKKKTKAKKNTQKRGKTKAKKKAGSANHLSFLGEGGRTILGWMGALVVGTGSLISWLARRTWEALHGKRGRQPLGMMLIAISIFTLVALVSYAAGDPGSNWSGRIGHVIADYLMRLVGVGSYLIPSFGIFWGFARLLRSSEGSSALLKLVGVLALAVTVALCARGLQGDPVASVVLPNGPGGWFGNRYYPNMRLALGKFGVVTLLVLLAGLSSLFATEWAFVPLIRELLRRGRASLRQPNLPLQPERPSLREQTKRNHQKATRGVKGAWNKVRSLLSPFHAPGEVISEEKIAELVGDHSKVAGMANSDRADQSNLPERLESFPATVQGERLESVVEREAKPPENKAPAAIPVVAMSQSVAEEEAENAPTAVAKPAVSAASAAASGVSAARLAELEAASGAGSLPGISDAAKEKSHALEFNKESPKKRRKKPR
ncbi:MAG: DNA translocase FtsK 4TM domain-containing protein [Planctomycetes bacterium]|nr:DNA translocase FtsK 4TM domain-containing protein [Planctomycetota bacterium]